MKALATEMTESFGKRLAPFGMKVRELTGDTQISKKDLAETQVLLPMFLIAINVSDVGSNTREVGCGDKKRSC